jgi:hypothetical protein
MLLKDLGFILALTYYTVICQVALFLVFFSKGTDFYFFFANTK